MDDRNEEIFKQYNLMVKHTYRARGALLLETNAGLKLFQSYEGSKEKLAFEHEVKKDLLAKGWNRIDSFVENKNGEVFTEDVQHNCYVIKDWFQGEECNLRELSEIKEAAENLGQLHERMRHISFSEEQRLQQQIPLPKRMEKHTRELKRVQSYLKERRKRNEFEICFLSCYEEFYGQAVKAFHMLEGISYQSLVDQAIEQKKMCHGSYNYHNILFVKDGIATTNFNKVHLGIQIYDFYEFLRKIMEKNNWKENYARAAMDGYQSVLPMTEEEKKLLYILLLYPEKFWKVTNFYYNNKKSWISKKNIQKLQSVKEQNQNKIMFLESYKDLTKILL